MSRQKLYISMALCVTILLSLCTTLWASENAVKIERKPNIKPDYTDTTLPPNIAPINFVIKETAQKYRVEIKGNSGDAILINSKKPTICIPQKKWKKLLKENCGQHISITISISNDKKQWNEFSPIVNHISTDSIDSHVAYRLINPGYVLWWDMGLYQRDLESFKETPIMTNRVTQNNCMNCHSFCQNDPEKMLFHMRAAFGGTVFLNDDLLQKINLKTDYTMSAGVYPSWHPNGNHVAFSVNKIYQYFHADPRVNHNVADRASDIIVYDMQKNQVTTSPKISTKRLENLPTWSADGTSLYFISGPEWNDKQEFTEVKYNLMNISYNATENSWGDVETVIDAEEINQSITFPKPSPDGKYIMFTMSDYGYFSIFSKSADLYLWDIQNKEYSKLDVNSPATESYHSWSSKSKWFVFVSKRDDGLCSRLYFSHLDENGQASKPFLLPQKDPEFYDTFIKNYNRPEMITGPVTRNQAALIKTARANAQAVTFDKTVNVDALSGATKIDKSISDKSNSTLYQSE